MKFKNLLNKLDRCNNPTVCYAYKDSETHLIVDFKKLHEYEPILEQKIKSFQLGTTRTGGLKISVELKATLEDVEGLLVNSKMEKRMAALNHHTSLVHLVH